MDTLISALIELFSLAVLSLVIVTGTACLVAALIPSMLGAAIGASIIPAMLIARRAVPKGMK